MPSKEAREVKVTLTKDGVIKAVSDEQKPHFFGKKGQREVQRLPLHGEHFEWDLEEYLQSGIPMLDYYTLQQNVASNRKGQLKHRNTVGLKLPILVKLDCGHWGATKRWREFDNDPEGPQREFGLIENGHVWLCQYTANIPDDEADPARSEFQKHGAGFACHLCDTLKAGGVAGIKVLIHAKADHPSLQRDPDVQQTLFVCLPDLHLPERWPDIPPEAHRLGGDHADDAQKKSRLLLQQRLRDCQREPHHIRGNTLGEQETKNIQDKMEELKKFEDERWNAIGQADAKGLSSYNLYHGKKLLHSFTPLQFLAEKDIIDRELRLRSTWFYGRGTNYASEVDAGKEDWKTVMDRNGNGDCRPAYDLVNFLLALRKLKADLEEQHEGWGKYLVVIQVGDLYETWVNHEFLYGGWWVRKEDAGSAAASMVLLKGAKKVGDDYQCRLDEHWSEPPGLDQTALSAGNLVLPALAQKLQQPNGGGIYKFLQERLGDDTKKQLFTYLQAQQPNHERQLRALLQRDLNKVIFGSSIYDSQRFSGVQLGAETQQFVGRNPQGAYLAWFNRLLLEDACEELPKSLRSGRRDAKCYIFNPYPRNARRCRHVVGDMIKDEYIRNLKELEDVFGLPPGELKRRQMLVKDRIDRCKDFRLRISDEVGKEIVEKIQGKDNYLSAYYKSNLGQASSTTYRDRCQKLLDYYSFAPPHEQVGTHLVYNAQGRQEVRWNLLILELLNALHFKPVYGNHDGYRGDPILKVELADRDKCEGWLSMDGIWCEHSHRWDEFNTDGCAFGAGAANLTYYYFNNMCTQSKRSLAAKKAKQEQKCFQPGAALWFLVVNHKGRLSWFNKQPNVGNVKPFGIYVSGHTHTGDLVVMRFYPEKSIREKKRVEELTEESDKLSKPLAAGEQASAFEKQRATGGSVVELEWLKPRP